MTHGQLVKAARQWLLNTKRCRVVLAEMPTAIQETPDCLGWRALESFLVECKTSRADFFADAKKVHRKGTGVGQSRWFLTPADLVASDEVPQGWGLLEYRKSSHPKGYFIREMVKPTRRGVDVQLLRRERIMLVSACWRAIEAQSLTRPIAIGGCD